jgi:DNA repair exonuclease SbcCD nuclease subunit
MKTLVISDLHLTEKEAESYRWEIFETVRISLEEHQIERLFILGDLLDKKDRHPAELINQLMDVLIHLLKYTKRIFILKGNHDYLKPQSPFLDFLRHFSPQIEWISSPREIDFGTKKTLWLPHSRNPTEEWNNLDFSDKDFVFMHQSVIGCRVSEYFEMNCGFDLEWLIQRLPKNHVIYSGDIHVPQEIKSLVYIGTPHPVSFGDVYTPNMLLLSDDFKSFTRIKTPTLQRHSLKISNSKDLEKLKKEGVLKTGDQAKIKIQLTSQDLSSWSETKGMVKHWCEFNQIELFDLSLEKLDEDVELMQSRVEGRFSFVDPKSAFKEYVKLEKVDKNIIAIGEELLSSALGK